ncbi:MAG: diaminopimelate epimerase [Candidatus Promineifilaceae bacterium]
MRKKERGVGSLKFWKYHGLGNDYLVIESRVALTSAQIERICHRNYGFGSDGILVQVAGGDSAEFGVKIYNPDGSEAEKSGNGLRIFTRYLFDTGQIKFDPVSILTLGGCVKAQQLDAQTVRVGMGQAMFDGVGEPIQLVSQALTAHVVSVGNPHCVIVSDGVASAEHAATELGAQLETHPRFPNRTNVQFVHIIDRSRIYIAIWERGAGRTLASGSSSCAAAAVAHRLGLCDAAIQVDMAGGTLLVEIGDNWEIVLEGAVTKVGEGLISAESLTNL